MALMTVADIREKIAANPDREEWSPIRRMSDEEIEKAIAAGFAWVAAMDSPHDGSTPFDLADITDAEVEAFAKNDIDGQGQV